MKVCIVAEGCYPYVVGGVSGWINSMIKSFPNVEFILLAIVANRSLRGKFVYELPENLTQVYEVYLDDCEWEGGGKKSGKKVHLSHKERDELLNMVLNRETDWGVIFDLFHKKNLSVDKLLMGPDFFEIAREFFIFSLLLCFLQLILLFHAFFVKYNKELILLFQWSQTFPSYRGQSV